MIPWDVTACQRRPYKESAWMTKNVDRLGSPWRANVFGVLSAVRSSCPNTRVSSLRKKKRKKLLDKILFRQCTDVEGPPSPPSRDGETSGPSISLHPFLLPHGSEGLLRITYCLY
ncbi:hypothetical protein AVEN_215894-1 [Araneus ventricosus]|uniref:Uncharacterized protein n=1 Tax=Araneus ventricosus TaxID=182803 RepID=A0A4Y2Q2Y4_ARAVE|nr:hypothetical protein AVEN_246286-1 [Araneus ventricosus]GBN58311.1 hypothetical protein AVEN_215894-1 [Araneus ventricosus]